MQKTAFYLSPLGSILLAADDDGLCGLWFYGAKHYAAGLKREASPGESPCLSAAAEYLDSYFRGEKPDLRFPLSLSGTDFQRKVWRLLLDIPYGEVTTYGRLAAQIGGNQLNLARAVGNAVGKNPVSIIIPCHRVVGAYGRLTGYAGGLERKSALLNFEKTGVLISH